jgi:hypothetical protein
MYDAVQKIFVLLLDLPMRPGRYQQEIPKKKKTFHTIVR